MLLRVGRDAHHQGGNNVNNLLFTSQFSRLIRGSAVHIRSKIIVQSFASQSPCLTESQNDPRSSRETERQSSLALVQFRERSTHASTKEYLTLTLIWTNTETFLSLMFWAFTER
ncbi:hypothetical protein NHX12_025016 [Muraenolepis orangiensis]|uniref:Uncharacterized protein n=1 Tax=Muraenolepis orangiensis TaxID=630683 RepID=A0A9Q0EII7_9TELE|nr:hypothetical protein NHX12_025016 [Muraenolepis orangiensis]